MIGLHTNVLVRYLVEDDPEQNRRAAALIEAAMGRGEILFVPDIVVCELVWVLLSAYGFSKEEVAGVLERLLRAEQLRFSTLDELLGALEDFRRGPADFADYLIRRQCRAGGCTALATFDRRLLRESGTVEP